MTGRFNVVGPGRAGRSFAGRLQELGWAEHQQYGRDDDPTRAAHDVDLCVLATPDAELSVVARSIEPDGAVVIHLSGASTLEVLAGHPRVGSVHPLVSLPEPELGRQRLAQCWFAVSGDPLARILAEEMSGLVFEVAEDDRALYHAGASIAANHLVALLAQVEAIATAVGVPLDAYLEMSRQTIESVADIGVPDSLTGPAARGDEYTLTAHIASLTERLPEEVPTYTALLEAARRLASRRGAD